MSTSPICPIPTRSVRPVGVALLAWVIIEKGFGRAALGRAVGVGILSHLILDLLTHGHDIVLWPGLSTPKLGLGLYEAAPVGAFIVEFLYGIVCWYVYRGGRGLLALIGLGNLANLSFLSPGIPGPEEYLAGRPMLLVTVIFAQIVVTLVLVGVLARRERHRPLRGQAPRPPTNARSHAAARAPSPRVILAQKPFSRNETPALESSVPKDWTHEQVEDIELAAGPASMEALMEARIARLEADVAHLRADVADIKVDLRARFDKVDARIDRMDAKVDAVKDSLLSAKVWALVLYFALAGSMLGVMARGFGWI